MFSTCTLPTDESKASECQAKRDNPGRFSLGTAKLKRGSAYQCTDEGILALMRAKIKRAGA